MENTDELGDVSTYQAPSIGEPRLISFLRTALSSPEHESIFQDVLDLGYNEWQKPEHEHTWGFEDMVHWVASQFGEVAALIIMFGKFNQQVENGGITQWLDNGYASDSKARRRHSWATISPDMDLSLLEEMLEGLTSVPLGNLPSAVKVSHILDDIRSTVEDANEECRECRNHRYVRCEVCDGAGTIVDEDTEDEDVEDQECPDCHGEGEVPCQNCNPDGTLEMDSEEGEVPTEQFERLDSYYYSFSQAWESEIENYLKSLIRSASGGGLLSRAQAIKATESILNLLDRILEARAAPLQLGTYHKPVEQTNRFLRAYQENILRVSDKSLDRRVQEQIREILSILANPSKPGTSLNTIKAVQAKYKMHVLTGSMNGYHAFHLTGGIVLVIQAGSDKIALIDIGTHTQIPGYYRQR